MRGCWSSGAVAAAKAFATGAAAAAAAVALCVGAASSSPAPSARTGTALATDAAIAARVVTLAGEPLRGAFVRAFDAADGSAVELASATTDAEGAFSLDVRDAIARGFSGSFVSLTIEHSGYATSRIDDVFVPPPSVSIGDIVLRERTRLCVRVTDVMARPVADASIFVAPGPERRRMPVAIERLGFTDARGRFESSAFGPGPVTIGVQATGFADQVVSSELLEHTASDLSIVVAADRAASVRIVDGFGAPVAGARAELRVVEERGVDSRARRPRSFWRSSETSDSDGWIRFEGLSRDTVHAATICAAGHRPVLVPLDVPTQLVTLEASVLLEVEASGPNGEALEIHRVYVRSDHRELPLEPIDTVRRRDSFWRDSPNVVRLTPSEWRLTVNDAESYVGGGRLKTVVVTTVDGRESWIDVPSDALADFVRIEAQMPALARVSGTVAMQDGRPVSLRLGWRLDSGRRDSVSTVSSSAGVFELSIPPVGPVWLDVLDDGWSLASRGPRLTVRAGESRRDVRLVVEPVSPPEEVDVTVQVTRDGAPPGGPVLLALAVRGSDLRHKRPDWSGWTNSSGEAVIRVPVDARLDVVPHARDAAWQSSWRSFAGEFAVVSEPWPWTIEPATFGDRCTIDLAHPLD
ncbi:MAG: carboxypeptidase regulatory-like domain-containing protein [Planctomycetes bacterium]|nr:carboxypeptidase regulatory-like domain-containing protein [Planctomycetota bacterium]